jgi:hypothetical protein
MSNTLGPAPINHVMEGSAKAWVNFNGNGTPAARNSLNISSITDNGSGDYTNNFANSLGDANFSATSNSRNSANNDVYVCGIHTFATSSIRTVHNNSSQGVLYASTRLDHTDIGVAIHGDLA